MGDQLSQHDLCDKGQVVGLHLIKRDPLKMRQFIFGTAKVIRIAAQVSRIGQKEAGVKATGAAFGCHGAKEKRQ